MMDSALNYDPYQFAGRHAYAISQTSHITFNDYSRMSTHTRKQVFERRLPTPIWALDDRWLRKLLVLFLEARVQRNHRPNDDLLTRRAAAEKKIKTLIPKWNDEIDRLQLEYVAAQHKKRTSKERLRVLEINIESRDTLVRLTQKSPLGFVAAIVVLYYRMGKTSVEVGEEVGCRPPHVRQILYRLNAIWNKNFNLDFMVEPSAPAVPACRTYTRQEIDGMLAAGKITIPKGDISLPAAPPGAFAPCMPGESRKERRARLIAAGLCGNCGLKPRGDYAECVSCRAYYAALAKNRMQKKKAG
jgi:hypothetical protein